MSFVLEAIRDQPATLYSMDDSSPLQDYSGYARSGTITGSPAQHAALVAGATYAPVLSDSVTASYPSIAFFQGNENVAFTLEATVKQVKKTATADVEQQVLGNLNQMDGLTVNGTVVSFLTKYSDGSTARASHDLQSIRSVHLVGVHTGSKNSLYVDGELVSEVDISEEQKALAFATTDGNLYTGDSASTDALAINGVAQYFGALPVGAIKSHFLASRKAPDAVKVSESFGGNVVNIVSVAGNKFLNHTWNSTEDWALGFSTNVSVSDGSLFPQSDGTTSEAGNWVGSVQLGTANTTSIYGVVISWEGQGAVVEASLDGTTWSSVTRGTGISIISPGFDPTGKVLLIRVSFPGGIIDDESFLDVLTVTGILSGTGVNTVGRTVTFNNAFPSEHHHQLEFSDMWGARINTGGSITISADTTAEGLNPRTVEVWIKADSGTSPTVSVSGTTYKNGVAASATLARGEWTLLHIVSATDITGTIVISGASEVGQVAFYSTALDATTIASIYNAYIGSNAYRVSDNSAIGVTQTGDAATIYAHDWAILGAG